MTESDAKALDAVDRALLARQGWHLTVWEPSLYPSGQWTGSVLLERMADPPGSGSERFAPGGLADALARLLGRFGVRA